jgi:uncharacterized protein YjbI with pentapeptide repeats
VKLNCEPNLSLGWIVSKIQPPQLAATLIVKGAYRLRPGKPATTEGAEAEVLVGDQYWEDDNQKSLRYSSDFAPQKPRADLLVVGKAHAPSGTPVTSLLVRFGVGTFSKTIEVIGNRTWTSRLFGKMSPPAPFVSMPLTYESAFGGLGDKKNPVGKGRQGDPPNLENPKRHLIGPTDSPDPAGFGPLVSTWAPRTNGLGTYNKKWLQTRWPWFPEDFDWGHFNAAPRDQQVEGYLRGDEEFELENLHPKHSVYRSRLPGLRARCFLNERLPSGEMRFREVPLNLDTFWIDMNQEKLILVWRGLADVRTIKLKEIEHILAATEPVSEPPKSLEHYRATLLAASPAPPAEEKEAGARAEAEFQARRAEMDKRFADAEKEFAQSEQEIAKHEAEAMKALEEQKAALIAAGVDPKLLEGPAEPQTLAQAGTALAASLAQLKASNPELAVQIDQIDPSVFQQIEQESQDLEKEMDDMRKEMAAMTPRRATRESVQVALTNKQPLEGQDLTALDLSGMDFAHANLAGSVLSKANLKGAKLTKTNLSKADLTGADLSGADLSGAILDESDLTGATLGGAKLTGLSLGSATLSRLDVKGADFSGSTGKGANFSKSKLVGARFASAKLPQADFSECLLEKADFRGAELQGAGFQSVKAPEINMEGAQVPGLRAGSKSVFTKGNFKRIKGTRSVWEESVLDGADFSRALLNRAQFSEASLRNALFDRADLSLAAFDDACLRGAVLTDANVLRATFDRADFTEAKVNNSNFYEAGFWETVTAKTDFQKANVKRTLLS